MTISTNRLRRRAISLLEVLFACVLLSVIAAATLAYVRQPSESVRIASCNMRVEQLQVLVEQYRNQSGQLPSANLRELTSQNYLGEAIPTCPVDGRSYQLNRTTGRVNTHGH